jgi:hypothetical protein
MSHNPTQALGVSPVRRLSHASSTQVFETILIPFVPPPKRELTQALL